MMPKGAQRESRAMIWHRFLVDETATTAIEYGLMVALISLTIIGAVSATGQGIKNTLYGQIVTALASMTK